MNKINYLKLIIYGIGISFFIFGLTAIIFQQNLFELIMIFAGKEKLSESIVVKLSTLIYLILLTGIFAILLQYLEESEIFKKSILNKNKTAVSFFFIVTFVTINIAILSIDNINNPNFWLDESGQFWISKGLYHLSPGFSDIGGITDVYKYNNQYNLDPGGFSYLLHFWSSLDQSPTFLRTLPFLFVLISFYLFYILLADEFKKKNLAIILAFLMISSPIISKYAFELRAYSFELFIAVSALFISIKSNKIIRSSNYSFFVGLWMALGLSSRYSSIISVFVASVFILLAFYRFRNFKLYLNFFLYIFPIIISLSLIYIFVLSIQNPSGAPPEYVSNLMLKNKSIYKIFLNPKAILVWLPVLLLSIIFIFDSRSLFIKNYLSFCAMLLFLLVILSYLGKYPLAFYSRFDISIHAIFWFGWIILLVKIFQFFEARSLAQANLLIIYFALSSLLISSSIKYKENDTIFANLNKCYNFNSNDTILANGLTAPTIKYHFEFGPLKEYRKAFSKIFSKLS